MKRFVTWLLLIVLVVGTLSENAEARRRKRRARKKTPIINEKKLYERIGGSKAVAQIVDEWVRMNMADQKIGPVFSSLTTHPEKMVKLRRGLNDQICELADGPCSYKGADMRKVHQSLAIGDEQFLIFSHNLFEAMKKYGVPEREKNEMLARLVELRPDVVHDGQEVSRASVGSMRSIGRDALRGSGRQPAKTANN